LLIALDDPLYPNTRAKQNNQQNKYENQEMHQVIMGAFLNK